MFREVEKTRKEELGEIMQVHQILNTGLQFPDMRESNSIMVN